MSGFGTKLKPADNQVSSDLAPENLTAEIPSSESLALEASALGGTRSGDSEVLDRTSAFYSIDTVSGYVWVRFAERLTFDDIRNYAMALSGDAQFNAGFSELVDLRRVQAITLTAEEQMQLADQVDPYAPTSKRAFVVRGQDQVHAAQVHRILRPESNLIHVFYSIEEAQDWIEEGKIADDGISGSGLREPKPDR